MDVLQKPARISRFCFRPGKVRGKLRCRKPAKPDSFFSMLPGPDRNTESKPAHGEWTLVQRAIDGNSDAHHELFVRHTSTLRRIAFRILRNREDAEDAVQDGLCKAYTRLGSFEGRSSFRTWLTRIVINSALMIRRRKNARPEASLDEVFRKTAERPRYEIIAAGPSPEEFCAASEIRALVEKQLRQLPSALQRRCNSTISTVAPPRNPCKRSVFIAAHSSPEYPGRDRKWQMVCGSPSICPQPGSRLCGKFRS